MQILVEIGKKVNGIYFRRIIDDYGYVYMKGVFFTKINGYYDDEGLYWYYENQTDKGEIDEVYLNGIKYWDAFKYPSASYRYFPYDDGTVRIIEYLYYPLDYISVIRIKDTFAQQVKECYIDDKYYEPRILEVNNLQKTKNLNKYGLITYNSGSISVINADNYFNVDNLPLYYGGQARVLYNNSDTSNYEDFKAIYTGYVQGIKIDRQTAEINLVDYRYKFEKSIIKNIIYKINYPYLNSESQEVPILYGKARGVKPICLNEDEEGAAQYEYKVVDTTYYPLTSLKVYIDNVETTPVSYDLNNGTFILTAEQKDQGEITCDIENNAPTNGIEIIKDILTKYYNIEYDERYYDINEVDYFTAICRETNYYTDRNDKVRRVIESICNDCDMIMYVTNNSKISLRIYDNNRAADFIVEDDEILEEIKYEEETDEMISSCYVLYDKHYSSGEYKRLYYDIYEKQIIADTGIEKTDEIKTNLTNTDYVEEKAENIMLINKSTIKTYNYLLPLQYYYDIEIGDFFIAKGVNDKIYIQEAVAIRKDIMSKTIELTGRVVGEYTKTNYAYLYRLEENNGILEYKTAGITGTSKYEYNHYDSVNYDSVNYGASAIAEIYTYGKNIAIYPIDIIDITEIKVLDNNGNETIITGNTLIQNTEYITILIDAKNLSSVAKLKILMED